MRRFLLAFLLFFPACLLVITQPVRAQDCTGRFVNPITDICWDCIFPLSIGGLEIDFGAGRPDTDNPTLPICLCPSTGPIPIPRIGLAIGFWEPARLIDVTRVPGCFVNLGGLEIGAIENFAPRGKTTSQGGHSHKSNWHVHYYIYPLIAWLEILTDFICLRETAFDLAYVSELDPLWDDDALTFLLNPEAILFANPLAQAACAADGAAASAHLPLDSLFWCMGAQGSAYPLNGQIQAHVGGVQASKLAALRMTYKLHRQLVAWGTSGEEALCGRYVMPVMKKSQYRPQITQPRPMTSGRYACAPPGSSTVFYESEREIPITGENFGWLLWRKTNCCAF